MAEAIGLAASLIAILELSAKTISYIQTAKGGTKERAQLTSEIQFCQILVGGLRDVSSHDGWSKTMKVLVEPGAPLKLLEETLRYLVQKLSRKGGIRNHLDVLTWPFADKEVKSILGMIERQKASLSLALDNNSRLLQDRIVSQLNDNQTSLQELKVIFDDGQESIHALARTIEQLKGRDSLQWVTALNFRPRHEVLLQLWDKNTGGWILQHENFRMWLHQPSTTIWFHGSPGAGKSVIAAFISHYLSSQFEQSESLIIVATLYCHQENQAEQTLDELERSVLHQVLQGLTQIPESISKLRNTTRPGVQPSLNELHNAFASSSIRLKTLYLVLDALDEASDRVQDEILGRLSRLPFPDVRLLCTSRNTPKFVNMFSSCLQIRITASHGDIETFVRGHIQENPRLRQVIGSNDALKRSIVEKIIEQADGMFLMARHHVESLHDVASKAEIRHALEHLPSRAKDAYQETMERILRQPKNDRIRALRALSLVFGARRQLSMSELQHAVAILTTSDRNGDGGIPDLDQDDLPNAEFIIISCHGLLVHENKDVRPCHYTVTEYFRETYRKWFADGPAQIASVCCSYLSQKRLHDDLTRHIRKLRKWRTHAKSTSRSENDARKIDEDFIGRHPFLQYAGSYWGTHFWEAHRNSSLSAMLQNHAGMTTWWANLDLSGSLLLCRVIDVALGIKTGIRTLQKIVQQGGDVNALSTEGHTLLSQAFSSDDTVAIEFLLTLDEVEVKIKSPKSEKLLETAVRLGLNDLTKSLLSTITIADDQNRVSPKDGVSEVMSVEEFRRLQLRIPTSCIDANQLYQPRTIRLCGSWDNPVLVPFYHTHIDQISIGQQRLDLLKTLLDKTCHCDLQDGRNVLLLILSTLENKFARVEDMKMAAFLLENNLDVRAKDEDGNDIRSMAVKHGHTNVVNFLDRRA